MRQLSSIFVRLAHQFCLPIIAATALTTAASAVEASQIIYDKTTSAPTGGASFTALEQGDEVRLDPLAPRSIVLLEIGLYQQGTAGTTDLLARLYANNGPGGGEPGTLLWESDLFRDISLTGGNDLIPFDVPNVTVSDVFTWTIQVSNSTPVAVGLPFFGEPSVGTSPEYVWFGGPGSWGHPSGPNYLARISGSTPVPGPLPLLGVGAAFAYSRKLRMRIKSSVNPITSSFTI